MQSSNTNQEAQSNMHSRGTNIKQRVIFHIIGGMAFSNMFEISREPQPYCPKMLKQHLPPPTI